MWEVTGGTWEDGSSVSDVTVRVWFHFNDMVTDNVRLEAGDGNPILVGVSLENVLKYAWTNKEGNPCKTSDTGPCGFRHNVSEIHYCNDGYECIPGVSDWSNNECVSSGSGASAGSHNWFDSGNYADCVALGKSQFVYDASKLKATAEEYGIHEKYPSGRVAEKTAADEELNPGFPER